MRTPGSIEALTELGRVRLSPSFFMRDFLHSEISAWTGLRNVPDDPDLAIAAGRRLCEDLLEPLQATFGRIAIRSGYRSEQVNAYGNAHGLNCASNERNYAAHIWDRRDEKGRMGATACVVVPWLLDCRPANTDWRGMAWWIHDHLPYSRLSFFPKLYAFNIQWREEPERVIHSFAEPKGVLIQPEGTNMQSDHGPWYAGFPELVRS